MDAPEPRAPRLVDSLGPREEQMLKAMARRAVYRDGQVIHDRGDDESRLCIVRKGAVKLMRHGPEGQAVLTSIVGEGHHYGDVVALHGVSRTHRAIALGELVIVDHVSQTGFDWIIANEPPMVAALYRITAFRLIQVMDAFDDARRLALPVRLAKTLCNLRADPHDANRVPCRHEDLAQALGVTTVTVGKALGQLARQGFIATGYRCVIIKDRAQLAHWIAAHDGN